MKKNWNPLAANKLLLFGNLPTIPIQIEENCWIFYGTRISYFQVALLAFEDMKLLWGRSTECGYWIESSTGLGFKDLSMFPNNLPPLWIYYLFLL
jgi:hypothetical protein